MGWSCGRPRAVHSGRTRRYAPGIPGAGCGASLSPAPHRTPWQRTMRKSESHWRVRDGGDGTQSAFGRGASILRHNCFQCVTRRGIHTTRNRCHVSRGSNASKRCFWFRAHVSINSPHQTTARRCRMTLGNCRDGTAQCHELLLWIAACASTSCLRRTSELRRSAQL